VLHVNFLNSKFILVIGNLKVNISNLVFENPTSYKIIRWLKVEVSMRPKLVT
jgi:hypothetical protein